MRKANKVKSICDYFDTPIKVKNYVMFEDNWISEFDKTLYNGNGDSFPVLDFKEVVENTLVNPYIMPFGDGWSLRRFSCVRLEKNVGVGDVFYTNI